MIIEFYTGYLDMETIRELIHVNKDGTTAYHIVEGAKKIGFRAMGFQCELENFTNERIVLPCIANVVMNKSFSHFIVIYEINYKRKYLIVADPANRIIKMTFDNFQAIYNGFILILYPEQKLPYSEKTEFSFKSLMYLLNGNYKFISTIFGLSLFAIIYAVASSFYSQFMLEGITKGQDDTYFIFLFLMFSVFVLLKTISEYFRDRIVLFVNQKIDLILNLDTFNKILSLPYCYYRNHTTGDILSRVRELSTIRDTLSKWIIAIIVDIPLMIVSFAVIYFINSSLALLSVFIFMLYAVLLKAFNKPLENVIEECQKENATLTSCQIEGISAFETIKGLSLQETIKRKIEKQEVIFLERIHQFQKMISLETCIKEIIQNIGIFIIIFLGCIYVKNDTMSFGALLTFQSLLGYFLSPVRQLVDLNGDTKNAKRAFIRMMEIYRTREERGFLSSEMEGNISFKNLTYSYNIYHNILNNISFDIRGGEKVIVLGQSGSGKSTLFKILKKYYDVNRGLVEIDGKDINDYKTSNGVSYINQTEMLFTETMYQNLTLGEKISEEELMDVINICEADNIIRNNSLGYNYLIEENGFNLSGGERQRIILARTLLRKFNILVIDEGLNQVDIDSERKILKNVFQKFEEKTIIVISHRPENMDLYDRIIRLKEGRLIENVVRNG